MTKCVWINEKDDMVIYKSFFRLHTDGKCISKDEHDKQFKLLKEMLILWLIGREEDTKFIMNLVEKAQRGELK
jgi:hypothetical protein